VSTPTGSHEKQSSRIEVRVAKWVIASALPIVAVLVTIKPEDLASNAAAYVKPVGIGVVVLLIVLGLMWAFGVWSENRSLQTRLAVAQTTLEERASDLDTNRAELERARVDLTTRTDEAAELRSAVDRLERRRTDANATALTAVHAFRVKRERTEIIEAAFAVAARSIDVIGVANEMVTTDVDEGCFEEFFKRGGHMRVMFVDPDGEAVKERERQERWPAGRLSAKSRTNIAHLGQYNRYARSGALQIRVYEHAPTVNMVIVDGSWVLAHHYGWSAHGTATPTLEINARAAALQSVEGTAPKAAEIARKLVDYYIAEYNDLWNQGRPPAEAAS